MAVSPGVQAALDERSAQRAAAERAKRKKVAELRRDGVMTRDIATRVGLSLRTVARWCKEMGLSGGPGRPEGAGL